MTAMITELSPEARIVASAASAVINDIGNDKDIFINGPTSSFRVVLLGLLSFLTAGLTGRNDVARDVMLYYVQEISPTMPEIGQEKLLEYAHEYYQAFREFGVDTQAKHGTEFTLAKLADEAIYYILGSDSDLARKRMVAYLNNFVDLGLNQIDSADDPYAGLASKESTILKTHDKIWNAVLQAQDYANKIRQMLERKNYEPETLNAHAKEMIVTLDGSIKRLEALEDDNNKSYVAACSVYITHVLIACSHVQLATYPGNQAFAGKAAEVLETLPQDMEQVTKYRVAFLQEGGFSDKQIKKITR